MQSPWEIFANFCVHCCAPALRNRARTLLNVGGSLRAFLGGCLESSSGRSSRIQDMGKFLGVGVDNCLGESWGKSDKALGGSCGSVRGFLRQLSSKMVQIPRGSWPISCAIRGPVPWEVVQRTCRMLETLAGNLGRLPCETLGESCKGLWGFLFSAGGLRNFWIVLGILDFSG